MKEIIRKNFAFLLPWLLFVLLGVILFSFYQKNDIHIYLNQLHNKFCNYFFYYVTYAGDGIAAAIIVFILLFVQYRFALLVAAANIFSSLCTQGLKHLVYDDMLRPKKYFEGVYELNFVPGVENYYYNSFPSGHATTAFATFFCLALCTGNKFIKLICFFTALTIGFSRVYLSQHFLNDVYAGSLIGVIVSILVYRFIILNEKLNKKHWMEKSLLIQ